MVGNMDKISEIRHNEKKRKRDDEEFSHSPKHPLLESITQRFQQNQADRQKKMTELETKRDTELAHSMFIKRNIADPQQLRRANETVKYWANRNGVKGAPILGARSKQRSNTTHTSRLDNESPQRTGARNSASSKNRKQNKNSENVDKEKEENLRNRSDSSSPLERAADRVEVRPSTPDVVDLLDCSQDLSTDCIEILDCSNLSNNSSPKGQTGGSTRNYVTRQTAKHVCTVLNCEAVFSSDGALGHHKNLFGHSPCNPCLKAKDCKIMPDPQCFMCPDCDKEFQTAEHCRKHMRSSYHMMFLPPLSITSYMCAHCLYVFETYQGCWEHIEESRHKDMSYPFADDQGANSSGGIGPVPVPDELLQDFIQKCKKVPYKLNCLECCMDLESSAAFAHHMLETENQHLVSALANTNLVDVFAEYLAGYICDTCHRLFNGGMKELAKHQCARTVVGTIIENNTQSFTEFIKRCALTVIKSEEPSQTNVEKAGPSNLATASSPRRRNKKIPVIEITDSPVVIRDTDDEELYIVGESSGSSPPKRKETVSNPAPDTRKSPKMKALSAGPVTLPTDSNSTNQANSDVQNNNPSTTTTSRRKKTRWDTPPENVDTGTKWLGLPVDSSTPKPKSSESHASQQSSTQPAQSTAPFPTCNFQGPPPLLSTQACANQQNFYCHPPNKPRVDVQFASSLPGQPRYPLRNQSRYDVPCKPPNSGTNSVRVGTKSAGPSTSKDIQVTGPSKATHLAPSNIPMEQSSGGPSLKRDRSRSPVLYVDDLVSVEHLKNQRNIIFLDLDNWPAFFKTLPRVLPEGTFVWGFFGGKFVWNEPFRCFIFSQMKRKGQFYLNEKCGFTKDAADFAIVLTVGKMDALLPESVAFTIMSGDKGFCEVERQMRMSKRKAVVINPHTAAKISTEMMYTMITSVTDT